VTNFTVDVGSMDSAATTIHRTQGTAEAVYSGLHELDIPHGTFDRVPWLSDKIAQPYEAHVKVCSASRPRSAISPTPSARRAQPQARGDRD